MLNVEDFERAMMEVARYVCVTVVQVLGYSLRRLILINDLRTIILIVGIVQPRGESWSVSYSWWTKET